MCLAEIFDWEMTASRNLDESSSSKYAGYDIWKQMAVVDTLFSLLRAIGEKSEMEQVGRTEVNPRRRFRDLNHIDGKFGRSLGWSSATR